MSFIKKHFKRVWKITKKIVKSKIFKYIVIAAAIFFTAGIAAGGFAAFGTTMAAAGGGIPGFFSAVGATMATGASSLASMVGMKGLSASLAAHGGGMATAAGLAGAPVSAAASGAFLSAGGGFASTYGVGASTAAATGAASGAAAAGIGVTGTGIGVGAAGAAGAGSLAAAGAAGTGAGFAGTIGKFLAKPILGNVTTGQLLANGVTAGFTAVLQSKANKEDLPNGYVAGGLARGGPSEAPPAISYEFGQPTTPESTMAGQAQQPSVASTLANQQAPTQGAADAGQLSTSQFMGARQGIDAISARLASRDQAPTTPDPYASSQGGLVMDSPEQEAPQGTGGAYGPFYDQATNIQYQRRGLA